MDSNLLKPKVILSILFLILILSACIGFEPIPTRSYIKNGTKAKIKLILYFDREKLKKTFIGDSYIKYLENYKGEENDYCVTKINLDTSTLIGTFEIEPECCFCAYRQVSVKQEYIFDKLMIINQNDTIFLIGYDKIFKAFKEIDKKKFELQIK